MKKKKLLLCLLAIMLFLVNVRTVSAALPPRKVNLLSSDLTKDGILTVRWEELNDEPGCDAVEGYRIQYSNYSDFRSSVSRYVTNRRTTMVVFTNLNAGNVYYVRVCGYSMSKTMRRIFGEESTVNRVVVPGTHLKQTIKGNSSFTEYYTANGTFKLGAAAKGKLTYKSSNTKVVAVSSKGVCTMKGYGTATITIKAGATAVYEAASKKVTIKIYPARMALTSVTSPAAGRIDIAWKRDSKADDYIIQISAKSDFSSSTVAKTIPKNSILTVSKTGMKRGTRYYVRIRARKVISKKNWYGPWSKVKYVVIK